MKKHIILTATILALTTHGGAIADITSALKTDTSGYDRNTYLNMLSGTSTMTEAQCNQNPDYCWRAEIGKCVRMQDTGYSATNKTCNQWCEYMEYDRYVYTNGTEFGCACAPDYDVGMWADSDTGRQVYFEITYTTSSISKCKKKISSIRTSQYRCKPGYYGTASNGCTACPAHATCYGGTGTTYFYCNVNYYNKNNGCTLCPDSKTGTKGFWEEGSGDAVSGNTYDTGAGDITDCYIDGLNELGTLCDSTGCFELTDECFYSNR